MNIVSALPYLNPLYTHQPVAFIVNRFLKKHRIKVDQTTLHQKLSEHPYFPSLLSISDVLNSLGLAHHAYKTDFASLQESLSSLLVHLNIQGGVFAMIEYIKNGQVKILTEKGETKRYTKDEFLKVWNGIVVALNEDVASVKLTDNESYPTFIKYVIAMVSALGTFYVLQQTIPELNWYRGIQLLLNSSALVLSWLLVLQHVNKNNVLVQQLCDSTTNEGCGSVLNSKSAQITPWLNMAEAGLLYFAGATATTLFLSNSALLYYLMLAAPVFSLYAIYLQAYVIKQWCRLCMMVHGVILLNFALTVFFRGVGDLFSSNLAWEFIAFLLPTILWGITSPFISKLKEASHFKNEYVRLKYNPEIFTSLVTQQLKVHIPDKLKIFTLGNRNAKHELTFVSNPFCGPCAKAHSVVEEWLMQDLDFKITIIFTHSADKNDKRRAFVERITNIDDGDRLEDVLHGWFNGEDNKNIQKWADGFDLQSAPLPYNEQDLIEWLDMADIQGTPTFFINEYRLPKTYRVADVRYLITEIP